MSLLLRAAMRFAAAMHTELRVLTDHGLTRFSFSQRPAHTSGYRRQRRRRGYKAWPKRGIKATGGREDGGSVMASMMEEWHVRTLEMLKQVDDSEALASHRAAAIRAGELLAVDSEGKVRKAVDYGASITIKVSDWKNTPGPEFRDVGVLNVTVDEAESKAPDWSDNWRPTPEERAANSAYLKWFTEPLTIEDPPKPKAPFKRIDGCLVRHTETMCMNCEAIIAQAMEARRRFAEPTKPPQREPYEPLRTGLGNGIVGGWNKRAVR